MTNHMIVCPDLLIVVGETCYRIWVGFIRSTQSSLFLYIFICISGAKSTLTQLCTQKSYSHNRKKTASVSLQN